MTTFQRLRALVREWRTFDKFPPEIPKTHQASMKLAAYACAEDLQSVLDEITEQRKKAGKKGGSRSTPATIAASRRNAANSRKKKSG